MSLEAYRRKRQFKETPEPEGKRAEHRGGLRFVVQKHQASRLHYDFRLELDGVLKSWAVPKGPSLDPAEKRLAMMVEDHPFGYRSFEGTIPEGNYGAGTVMVWDEGTYRAAEVPARAPHSEHERSLRKGLEQGDLKFILDGKKLKGEFVLARMKRADEENAWLLIKKRDDQASDRDIQRDDRSAKTGRSLEEISEAGAEFGERREVWLSGAKSSKIDLSEAPERLMPHGVKPMLATLTDAPFDRAGWLFEIKWDGYRAVAEVAQRGVELYSRSGQSFKAKFPPVVRSLERLGHEVILDGEVVAVDEQGKSRFQLLQNYQRTGRGRLVYYVFDLLYLDGRDLRELPLRRRKELLRKVLPRLPHVKYSDHVEERGSDFFRTAVRQGLEGIIAKNGESPYRAGKRTREWLKVKGHLRQEAVIGGFTEPRGGRKHLGALVLGVFEGTPPAGGLIYIGHTGGGFGEADLKEVRRRLEPLIRERSPFKEAPKTNTPVRWVMPKLVCEVSFQEWTTAGHMRQPIFMGLREDKPARSVRREEPASRGEVFGEQRKGRSAKDREEEIGGKEIRLTNQGKVFWPDEGYTKGDLIAYYREIAPVILPYLRDRPENLHRHPDGIEGEGFYQKNVDHQPPKWAETIPIHSEEKDEEIRYLVCQDEATLIYMANLGCIEINPWNSRTEHLEQPDYLIIDLDPEEIPFREVVRTAQAVREVLEEIGIPGYPKTSGATGLHIYVPLGARYTYEQARRFAEIIARLAYARVPDVTSLERSPAKRQGKVYLDYLQNSRGQTLAAAYSVRPRPGAPVATPLRWDEVTEKLDPTKFTIKNTLRRLEKKGDLWRPVLGKGVDIEKALRKLEEG